MVALWRNLFRWACGGLLLLLPFALFADFTLNIGPPQLGTGGANPVAIPPTNILDYSLVYLTAQQTEWTVSVSPGAFYGYRFNVSKEAGVYVSAGGGVALDGNGLGPAVYSAVGWNKCGTRFCFNAEYKQALGFSTVLMSPYAFRIGVTILSN